SKGIEDWQRRHEGYARKEAEQILAAARTTFRARDLSRDAIARRRALKRLAGTVPFRGGLRFLHCIILQRAFLDGRAGVAYARLLARYERMIAANVRSLRRRSGRPRLLPLDNRRDEPEQDYGPRWAQPQRQQAAAARRRRY